jgi:hypothetical protein
LPSAQRLASVPNRFHLLTFAGGEPEGAIADSGDKVDDNEEVYTIEDSVMPFYPKLHQSRFFAGPLYFGAPFRSFGAQRCRLLHLGFVHDANWEGTYSKPTELGEPIHKLATRGVKLWTEFNDTVFSLPKEKRTAWLVERPGEKLNADFAKPWFGWKKDGSVAEDLGDMTYEVTMFHPYRPFLVMPLTMTL